MSDEAEQSTATDTEAGPDAGVDRQRLLNALTAVLTLLSVWIAADPDGPARLWYRVRLWLAYRNTVNTQRLAGLRLRAQAGAFADDASPTTTTIGEVAP